MLKKLTAILLPLLLPFAAFAQTGGQGATSGYPNTGAVYIPTAIGAPVSILAANAPANMTWPTNGLGTVRFTVSGTYTSLVGTFQCATDRSATPVWKNISVLPAAGQGGRLFGITANGAYVASSAGCAQVQFAVASMGSGTVTVAMAAAPHGFFVDAAHERRATYSALAAAVAPAAAATDFLTICGNASTTVRITRVQLNGTSTAAATDVVLGLIRNTADTAGTSSNATAVPHDANDPAAVSVVKAYTANPTIGTLVANVRASSLATVPLSTPGITTQGLVWTFGDRWNEELVLRGAAQCFALNNNGATFTAGASLYASVEWTEE